MKNLIIILLSLMSLNTIGQDFNVVDLQEIRNKNIPNAEKVIFDFNFKFEGVLSDGKVYKYVHENRQTELYLEPLESSILSVYIKTFKLDLYETMKETLKTIKAIYVKSYTNEESGVYHLYEKGNTQIILNVSNPTSNDIRTSYFVLVKPKDS